MRLFPESPLRIKIVKGEYYLKIDRRKIIVNDLIVRITNLVLFLYRPALFYIMRRKKDFFVRESKSKPRFGAGTKVET